LEVRFIFVQVLSFSMRSLFICLEYIYVYGYAGKIIRAPSGVMHGKSSPVFYDEELGKALFDGLPKYVLLKMYCFICFYFFTIFMSTANLWFLLFYCFYVSFFFLSFYSPLFTFFCVSVILFISSLFLFVFLLPFLSPFLFHLSIFVSVFRLRCVSYLAYPTCLRLKGCCCHVYC
jgi:hypothetical protein